MNHAKLLQTKYREVNGWGGPEFYTAEGLDIKLILQRFQVFMKEHYWRSRKNPLGLSQGMKGQHLLSVCAQTSFSQEKPIELTEAKNVYAWVSHSDQDAQFLEREGRLLFLSYLRPIINGRGFDFKEPNVSQERRMDLVITYQNKRYVIELKIWRGPKYHQEGLKQLSDYLDTYTLKAGYLLIYDFNKNKTYKQENITFQDKQVFAVWV